MKDSIGIKLKNEKIEKKTPTFLTGLLAIILIIAYTYTIKNYEPAKNIIITGGIMVYPLSFLIIALISKYYGFKEARKSIFTAAGLYVAFIVLVMIATLPRASQLTSGYNAVLQFLFTNNIAKIGEFTFYYPTLGQFFGVLLGFLVSHLIYATIYNAVNKYTVDYLAAGLGIFIAYIIDRLIYIPTLYARGLYTGNNTFDFLIQCLTSEFIATIAMTIVIIILYIIITAFKKSDK